MDNYGIQKDSASWIFFVKVSFFVSVLAMGIGIWFLPTEHWVKGYMAMGVLYIIGSSITFTKTLRDEHEANKLIKKLNEVKNERLLKDNLENSLI